MRRRVNCLCKIAIVRKLTKSRYKLFAVSRIMEKWILSYGGRKGPSHPSLTDALPYFHWRFHTSIGASILPSALPYFHRRFLTSIGASALPCTTCCACAKHFAHAQSVHKRQAAPDYTYSTNAHEVKSWMASNRQGPFLHLFGITILCFSFFYTSSCTLARFLKSSTLPAHT